MCGIAGIALKPEAPPIDPATIEKLALALAHRGPDGTRSVIGQRVALVHARLAIIAPTDGDQPLFAPPCTLIANGEIYNDLTLRASLREVKFKTGSDCEAPLYLYAQHGEGFMPFLRGMYAMALHNDTHDRVILLRDPFGIKPLYIADIDGGIAFASEPAALVRAGLVAPQINRTAAHELLQLQYSTGHHTIFQHITRVPPGQTVRIDHGAVMAAQPHKIIPPSGPEKITEQEAIKRFECALMESVAAHMRADVPFGLFLSGGIDSASVLVAMTRVHEAPIQAFTAGFDVPGAADERSLARDIAKSQGARHDAIEITRQMVWDYLPRIVACMDDPVADYAIIPTWFLGRHAKASVKMVLSGEGGDEIFGGYGRYRRAARPWFLGGGYLHRRGACDGLDLFHTPPPPWRAGLEAALKIAHTHDRSRLQIAQALDIAEWLPNDLLIKLDRCLMAHGVEGRTPFLDPVMVQAGFCLPDALKVRGGRGKYLLRTWLAKACPAARPFAPKQGFTVPVQAWIAQWGHLLGPLVAAQPGVAEIARADAVKKIFAHAGDKSIGIAAWRLLFYALWHQHHILGGPANGTIDEALKP